MELDLELSDTSKIDTAINQSQANLLEIGKRIKSAQDFQKQKDKLSDELKSQNQSIEKLKTIDVSLGEKIKNLNAEIDSKQNSIDELTKTCARLESDLKSKLGVSILNYHPLKIRIRLLKPLNHKSKILISPKRI